MTMNSNIMLVGDPISNELSFGLSNGFSSVGDPKRKVHIIQENGFIK